MVIRKTTVRGFTTTVIVRCGEGLGFELRCFPVCYMCRRLGIESCPIMHPHEDEKLTIFIKDGHPILDVSSEGCTLLSDEDERISDVCLEVEKLEDGTVEELYEPNLLAWAWYSGEAPGEVVE